MLTIRNTKPEFFWVTNFLETIMSTELWLPMTSATIARGYKQILLKWADKTCNDFSHLPFQGHDFSMRGMAGLEAAMMSGAGHLLAFLGTDTIPAVDYAKEYYFAEPKKELIGTSIPATEHSVMSMGSKEDELGTFRKLITEIYPNGFISIVSDTWDLWKVLTEYVPALKEEILARDGKVVIRPDSGDPVDIICGRLSLEQRTLPIFESQKDDADVKGVIELLWDIFGGHVNSKGYKVLDSHIGAIYGDSITLERADQICARLEAKGFASSNIVLGIGSYTYQYNSRDTYGFAMKATYGEVFTEGSGNVGREIYKDPITDSGMKKSLKGLLSVSMLKDAHGQDLKYVVKDQCTWKTETTGELKKVYENGVIFNPFTWSEIRANFAQTL